MSRARLRVRRLSRACFFFGFVLQVQDWGLVVANTSTRFLGNENMQKKNTKTAAVS